MKYIEHILFSLIIILFVFLRLYKINTPLADWHSWRQADTLAVSRNFLKSGFDLLKPTYDDISQIQTGQFNPQGLRLVEFPLYNAAVAMVASFFPPDRLVMIGRLVSILASSGTLIFIYLIVHHLSGKWLAWLSVLFFAVLPYNIYYARTILPEPSMTLAATAMLYFWLKYIETEKKMTLMLSSLFGVMALLVKALAIFYFAPILYLMWRRDRWSAVKRRDNWLFLIITILPLVLWRLWISHFPEGIPANWWLLNGDGIRFKGAFFRWLIQERMGRLILTAPGMFLFLLGMVVKPAEKEGWFYHWWLAGVFLYFAVFATGNVRHDYYQIPFIPIAAIFLAKGAQFLLIAPKEYFNRILSCILLVVSCILFLAFGWYEVRGFFNINHPEIVKAGRAVDRLAPKDALVIAPYQGDTAFLFQTNRKGWPMVTRSIEELINLGASYYVSVEFDELTKELMDQFPVIERNEDYVVIRLLK